ncbi:MAG: secretin N-terminal domain-containing protein, partial [Candidatus Omnitrophota bacterium]|nr:secretin N-terminal domain-containing protein [Candidatus Omnitrophota bacterium]
MKRAYKKALLVLALALFLGVLSLPAGYVLGQEAVGPLDKPTDMGAATQSSVIIPSVGEAAGSELISVNFVNADILEVIGVFSEKTGLNMVVGPDVKAAVTIELNSLPWERALDIILKNYNLTYKKEDKLIRVMTLEQLKQEDEKVPLITKVVTFNFARAEDVKSSFSSMLSPRGRVEVNARTNSLIITDLPDNVEKIEIIATSLDSRTPQVMIEALMADVKLTNEEQLGINWKFARNADWTTGKSAKAIIDQNITLPASSAATIVFGQTILKATDLTATIKAWQQEKRVNILAHPMIMTLDNQSARIELVEQIPYTQQSTSTESSSAISTTSFKEAGIKLDVTPHITTKDNYISMNLKVEQSFRSGYTPDNQP